MAAAAASPQLSPAPSAQLDSLQGSSSLLLKSKSFKSLTSLISHIGRTGSTSLSGMVEKEERLKRLDTKNFKGLHNSQRVDDVYELKEQIGKGAFGVVRVAVDRETGVRFCCKSIPREALNAQMFEDIRLEAEVMTHLRGHPNIVEIMGLFEDDEHLHIVEEMCTGGDLYTKLANTVVPYTEREAASIMRTVLQVLEHCHAMGVLVRDVKPDNFLLSTSGPNAVLKATDFGVSKFMKPGETTSEFCGTPTYMAPEVFDMEYGFPADVWSAGIMLYWVLSGDFPFKGRSKMELGRKVTVDAVPMEGNGWEHVSAEAKDCVRAMLTKDPKKRPTAAEMLQHRWFKHVSKGNAKPLGNIMLQRIRAFADMNEFKQEVMRVVARTLDDAYLIGLRSMFTAIDTDNTGSLSREKINEALIRQGVKIPQEELTSLIKGLDPLCTGQVDFMGFAAAALSSSMLERKELLQQVFSTFDRDGDGVLNVADVQASLPGSLSSKRVAKLISRMDANRDGKVEFTDFCITMLGAADGKEWFRWRVKKPAPGTLFSAEQRPGSSGRVPNIYSGASTSGASNNPFRQSKAGYALMTSGHGASNHSTTTNYYSLRHSPSSRSMYGSARSLSNSSSHTQLPHASSSSSMAVSPSHARLSTASLHMSSETLQEHMQVEGEMPVSSSTAASAHYTTTHVTAGSTAMEGSGREAAGSKRTQAPTTTFAASFLKRLRRKSTTSSGASVESAPAASSLPARHATVSGCTGSGSDNMELPQALLHRSHSRGGVSSFKKHRSSSAGGLGLVDSTMSGLSGFLHKLSPFQTAPAHHLTPTLPLSLTRSNSSASSLAAATLGGDSGPLHSRGAHLRSAATSHGRSSGGGNAGGVNSGRLSPGLSPGSPLRNSSQLALHPAPGGSSGGVLTSGMMMLNSRELLLPSSSGLATAASNGGSTTTTGSILVHRDRSMSHQRSTGTHSVHWQDAEMLSADSHNMMLGSQHSMGPHSIGVSGPLSSLSGGSSGGAAGGAAAQQPHHHQHHHHHAAASTSVPVSAAHHAGSTLPLPMVAEAPAGPVEAATTAAATTSTVDSLAFSGTGPWSHLTITPPEQATHPVTHTVASGDLVTVSLGHFVRTSLPEPTSPTAASSMQQQHSVHRLARVSQADLPSGAVLGSELGRDSRSSNAPLHARSSSITLNPTPLSAPTSAPAIALSPPAAATTPVPVDPPLAATTEGPAAPTQFTQQQQQPTWHAVHTPFAHLVVQAASIAAGVHDAGASPLPSPSGTAVPSSTLPPSLLHTSMSSLNHARASSNASSATWHEHHKGFLGFGRHSPNPKHGHHHKPSAFTLPLGSGEVHRSDESHADAHTPRRSIGCFGTFFSSSKRSPRSSSSSSASLGSSSAVAAQKGHSHSSIDYKSHGSLASRRSSLRLPFKGQDSVERGGNCSIM